MRWALLCLLALAAGPAEAQPQAARFPVERQFQAETLDGRDLRSAKVTLTVARAENGFRGSGSAGCNRWTAGVKVGSRRLTVSPVATTRMFCGKPLMTIEAAFVKVLRANPRWQMQGRRLVLRSRAGTVIFAPAAP